MVDSSSSHQQAYSDLLGHLRQVSALSQISGVLSWDQEVMMPPQGAGQRAEQAAALEAVTHERRTDRRIGDWLDQIDIAKLDDVQKANVRLARRAYERSIRIPGSLAQELAKTTALAQGVWAQARKNNNFAEFSPHLTRIIELKRQEAACLAGGDVDAYDALLDDFEPGMTAFVLQPLLEDMRPSLVALRDKIANSSVKQPDLLGPFDTDVQMTLARALADIVGYNWSAGRLDLSVHPFSSGTAGDSRITTRVDPDEPLGCLYSTIHELGHALYEQGIPEKHLFSPVGTHVSMGVHESQSRLWENQIGRSKAFCEWFFPHFKEAFADSGVDSADDLYRAVNRVETGFIRTEADEVHYNLHVLLRFELERDLISGALDVDDLESEWNRRFERDFGLAVPDAVHGLLQDVHWSVGLFGYFPTYSLGNIYAGQLHGKLLENHPDLDASLAKGDTAPVLTWLRKTIHEKGSLYAPEELMEKAVGEKVSSAPLLNYLEAKYSELFNL